MPTSVFQKVLLVTAIAICVCAAIACESAEAATRSMKITSPASGSEIRSSSIKVRVSLRPRKQKSTRVRLLIDGVLKATDRTTPFEFNLSTDQIGDGRHTITVQAKKRGRSTLVDRVRIRIQRKSQPDLVPPTAPSNLIATSVTQSALTLGWDSSTDNVGIDRYEIARNGSTIGTTQSTSFTLSALSCSTTYEFVVTAYDSASNAASSPVLRTSTASCGGSSSSPSGVDAPSSNLPGWRLIFADDFTVDAAPGSWGSECDPEKILYTGAGGTRWRAYPKCYKDTYQKRPYRSDRVLSVHDGTLDFYLHNVDGVPAGANPSPVLNGNSQYQTYGRYSARLKVDNTDLSEYYMAWLLWPQDESKWASAESDYPEGSLRSGVNGVHGFHHYGPGQQEAFGHSGVDLHEWHTYTQEWQPGVRRYYVDDTLIFTSLAPVFAGPERWQLQTETNGNGTHAGHLLVDWVAVYSYSP